MDRQAIIGFVLIAVVFMVWMYTSMPDPDEQQQQESTQKTEQTDSVAAEQQTTGQATEEEFRPSAAPAVLQDSAGQDLAYGKWFSHRASGEAKTFTVETDLYTAVFSTKGGTVQKWTLAEYSTWNKKPLQLIDWRIKSDLNLFFGTVDGKLIDTKNLFFTFSPFPENGKVVLTDSAEYTFDAVIPVVGDSAYIVKRYTLRNGEYDFEFEVELHNMGAIIANNEYQITLNGLNNTEKNSVDEASFAEANALVKSERMTVNSDDRDELDKENFEGRTKYISTHTKYFLNAIIADDETLGNGAYIEGVMVTASNEGVRELYQASIKMDYRGNQVETGKFTVFIGPMQYDLLKSYEVGLEQVMSLGWDWIIRPFSEYLVIPLFTFLHKYIPNYGWVIIIFSILIKLLLYPLTKSSMKSMKKMQALGPLQTELKEKYKDDPQKQSAEMMKLYKDYGVNPAGGCLPMMLQMPILFALFTIFRSTIQLRHEPFIWWIQDLSAPDILVHLPFQIPILGFSYFSGLAFLMGITMFFQQKMSISDPRQKQMVYIMPVMFWLLFNSFPSGLNLYYFMFNLLSIGQQYMINKSGGDIKLEKVKKSNKKSWTEKMMEQAQQRSKEQQKSSKRR